MLSKSYSPDQYYHRDYSSYCWKSAWKRRQHSWSSPRKLYSWLTSMVLIFLQDQQLWFARTGCSCSLCT